MPPISPTLRAAPPESPPAAEAFAAYVAMGPSRSLRSLAALLAEQGRYKTATTAFSTVAAWSGRHRWQERLTQAINERTAALIAEAAELDASTFLATSREYRRRTDPAMIGAMPLDAIHPLRDRVKPAPAVRALSVEVSVTIRREAERLAAGLGIPAVDLLAEAERIAAAEWGKD